LFQVRMRWLAFTTNRPFFVLPNDRNHLGWLFIEETHLPLRVLYPYACRRSNQEEPYSVLGVVRTPRQVNVKGGYSGLGRSGAEEE
jgi:hypothetical protein